MWAYMNRRRKARGIAVKTFVQPLSDVDRAVLDGESAGFVKVHIRAGTDKSSAPPWSQDTRAR